MENRTQKIIINILATISTIIACILFVFFIMCLTTNYEQTDDSLGKGIGLTLLVMFFMIAFFTSLAVSGLSLIISLILKITKKLPYKGGIITISIDLGATLLMLGLLLLIFNILA